MNPSKLARALRVQSDFVREVEDGLVPTDRLPTPEELASQRRLRDSGELTRVLARVVDGQPLARAFGSPGDWGYETIIGAALAAAPEPAAAANDAGAKGQGMPTVVEILPTRIWIENGFFGERAVMVQHEGLEPFRYALFDYAYGYTDNASTLNAATRLAVALGAVEPVEMRQREFPSAGALAGPDLAAVALMSPVQLSASLRGCLDVLLRMIPEHVAAHGGEQCTDTEHNAAIAAAAEVLYGADRSTWPAGVRDAADGAYGA